MTRATSVIDDCINKLKIRGKHKKNEPKREKRDTTESKFVQKGGPALAVLPDRRRRPWVAHHVTALIFYNINRCYGKHVAVFAIAVATGDIIEYQSFVYGSFAWEIRVRYNNCKYYMYTLKRSDKRPPTYFCTYSESQPRSY